jgi:protein-disulfide isomerase
MTSGRGARRTRPTRDIVGGRRGPSTATIIGVLVVVLFAGAVGFGVYRAQQTPDGPVAVPAGATATAVTVGRQTAPVTVELYLDFQCPACQAYEAQVGPVLDELVASGRIKVAYHPLAYLDRFSGGTRYSTRSSQASACAADSGVFLPFARLLFADQPPENGTGLPDEQLIALGRQAGAGDGFAECVQQDRYAAWTATVTDAASKAGVNSTPTVLVNGREIERTPEALRAAVAAG